MHTLLEELRRREEREKGNDSGTAYMHASELADELLETEKQQIKRAFNVGGTDACEMSSDDYYNDTFSTNKETLK